MDWVRGGTWELEMDKYRLGTAYLLPRTERRAEESEADAMQRIPWEASVGMGAELFLTNRKEWEVLVASPCQLEYYDAKPSHGERILEFMERFLVEFEDEGSPNPLPESGLSALANFLKTFGPLQAVSGIIGVGLPGPYHPHFAARTVNLFELQQEISKVGRTVQAVKNPETQATAKDRERLARYLLRESEYAFRDMQIIPTFTDGGLVFAARPTTLRALVWRTLLDRWGRPTKEFCKYCERAFEVPVKPGMPPKYCADHREVLYRQRVRRGTAPWQIVARKKQRPKAASPYVATP